MGSLNPRGGQHHGGNCLRGSSSRWHIDRDAGISTLPPRDPESACLNGGNGHGALAACVSCAASDTEFTQRESSGTVLEMSVPVQTLRTGTQSIFRRAGLLTQFPAERWVSTLRIFRNSRLRWRCGIDTSDHEGSAEWAASLDSRMAASTGIKGAMNTPTPPPALVVPTLMPRLCPENGVHGNLGRSSRRQSPDASPNFRFARRSRTITPRGQCHDLELARVECLWRVLRCGRESSKCAE